MSSPRIDPATTSRSVIERIAPATVRAAAELSSATLHEAAGKIGALPSAIKPVAPGFRLCGPAVTVQMPPGDNLWLHRAIYLAEPGDVLVVHAAGALEHGYWGEIMSTAAKVRGLAGLVIDGGVRDLRLLAEIGFPVFARGICIRGTSKDFSARGWINAPVLFDQVVVRAGDLVFGDADGVVCIPRERAAEVVEASRERDRGEAHILERLRSGESTLEIYGWA